MTREQDQANKDARQHAAENIASVGRLLEDSDFNRFMSGFKAMADQLADQVLHDDELTMEKREMIRQKRLGILEVLKGPQTIIQGSESVMKAQDR